MGNDDPFFLLSLSETETEVKPNSIETSASENITPMNTDKETDGGSFFANISPTPDHFNDNGLSSFAQSSDSQIITSEDYNFEEEDKLKSEIDNVGNTYENFSDPLSALFGDTGPKFEQPKSMAEDFAKTQTSINQSLKGIQEQAETIQNIAYPGGGSRILEDAANYSYMDALEDKLFGDNRPRIKVNPDEKEEVGRKLTHLKTEIQKSQSQFAAWERKSGKWALVFQVLSSALAALVTILLGIEISSILVGWWIKTVALIITAFISIIGVIQRFFDADEKYAKYMDTSHKLDLLLKNINYLELGIDYITLSDVNSIRAEYNRILLSTYQYEMTLIADSDKTLAEIKQQGLVGKR